MCVHMCECVFVCSVRVYMYACGYVSVYAYESIVQVHVRVSVYVCARARESVYVCKCAKECECACESVYVCACV